MEHLRLRSRADTITFNHFLLGHTGAFGGIFDNLYVFNLLVFKIKGNMLLGLFPTNLSPFSCLLGCF